MSSVLNLGDYTAKTANAPLTGDSLQQAKNVKLIGIIALVLSVLGIFVPFVLDIAAFVLAKIAFNISRKHLVPIEYEKPAYWAYRLSLVGLLLWVIILFRALA